MLFKSKYLVKEYKDVIDSNNIIKIINCDFIHEIDVIAYRIKEYLKSDYSKKNYELVFNEDFKCLQYFIGGKLKFVIRVI